MLIAMTILWLTGGGAADMWLFPADFTDRVETVVTDESRQTAVIDLYDEIVDHFADHKKRVKEIAGETRLLNGNYDADESSFEPVIDRLLQTRKEFQAAVFNARMKMIEQVDQNEWQQMFAADSIINND